MNDTQTKCMIATEMEGLMIDMKKEKETDVDDKF